MGVCPLFQCSLCLQGLGPFGGPGAPWEAELWSPVSLGSMGKHPRSTYITWSIAEVLGLVWLSLNGYVAFVSVLFVLARVGAMWGPLRSSACKGWGRLVAPVRPGRLIFDVFEAAGGQFLEHVDSFWAAGAPCGHLPGPSAS